MANEILQKVGTQIRFLVAGSFSPVDPATDWTISSPTPLDVVLTLSGVADDAGRQSAKVDLGEKRANIYDIFCALDFTGEVPVTGEAVEFHWAPSTIVTAANANVAGNSGLDGVAPDGALGSITLDEFIDQCVPIDSFIVHNGGVVQNGFVSVFSPPSRFGQMVVVNRSGAPFEADNVEMCVFMNPRPPEIQ